MKAAIKDSKAGKPVFLVTQSQYERQFTQLVDLIKQLTTQVGDLRKVVVENHQDARDGIKELLKQTRAGFVAVDKRFDRLEGRMDGLEGRMGRLEGRMDGLEGRMDGLEGRMDGLEGGMGRLEGRMDRLEGPHTTRP